MRISYETSEMLHNTMSKKKLFIGCKWLQGFYFSDLESKKGS